MRDRMTSQAAGTTPVEHGYERLQQIIGSLDSACIGYSGGVDSTLLAVVARRTLGSRRVLAVTGLSPAYPEVQRAAARAAAREFGIPHVEIETHELADERYASNPANRCYFCKSELWPRLAEVARARGLATVLDGSNSDDAQDYRPGFAAAREHAVRSPLLEAGLTKADVRSISRMLGLPTWDQPSAPCLSSRLPYGVAVTPTRLRHVELAEAELRQLGFRELRVRHHDDCVRVELAPPELPAAERLARAIDQRLRAAGVPRVLIDVEGYRRGALNEALVQIGGGAEGVRAASHSAGPARRSASDADRSPGAAATRAGFHGDIAVVHAASLAEARLAAAELRARGYRYVAVDAAQLDVAS